MDLQQMEDTSGVLRGVRAQMARKNLALPHHPGDEVPSIPRDLSGVPGETLMELMTVFEALASYANGVVAEADAVATAKAAEYKIERAKAYLILRDEKANGIKMSNDEIDAKLEVDDRLMVLKNALVMADSYKTMMKAVAGGFESKYALLSRELTRRGNRGERE